MRLRARLALALTLSASTLSVCAALWQRGEALRAFDAAAVETLRGRADAGSLDVCERFASTWPRPARPGPQRGPTRLYAFRDDLRSDNPWTPSLPTALLRELPSGASVAAGDMGFEGRRGRVIAARVGRRRGPCAVLAMHTSVDVGGRALRSSLAAAAAVAALVTAVALIAAGPLVRRVRRLTSALSRGALDAARAEAEGDDELSALAAAYLRRAEASTRAENALREHLANTSHDLMVPLTVLIGHVDATRAAAEARGCDVGRARAALEECHHIAALVENLAASARLDGDAPQLHRTDLGGLVERVCARNMAFAAQRGVALNFSTPEARVEVDADVTLAEQALANVVQNAIAYNRAGGHVAVLLSMGARGFALRVIDDGPGVSPEELARLSERGYRGTDARETTRGQGLGLAITAEVARRHGWRLSFERPDEGGLSVTFEG